MKSFDENKREVFTSLVSHFKKNKNEKLSHVRPPYNTDNSLFKICLKCEEKPCANACEESIIKLDEDKTPFLNFENSGCTFCGECAKACKSEVLVLSEENWIKSKFSIDTNNCLAWNSVMCSSCVDACEEKAINFFSLFRPTIDMNKCSGCGFCYSPCPPYAIKYKTLKEKL